MSDLLEARHSLALNARLARSTPESEGVPQSALLAFLDEVEKQNIELHSLMVLRHGNVVAEAWWAPYEPQTPHFLYSLSKSFTSTAIGIAIAEGLLSLDDTVVSFFPDKLPSDVSENLRAMTVRHLLTMSTGQSEANRPTPGRAPGTEWVKDFLAFPVTEAPGSKFDYSTPATFMCSAIIRRVAGEDLLDYLMPRLFTPLGIERPTWQQSPEGISVGGSGLSLTTESIAKFGQLYLQMGRWNGQQLVPAEWVAQATSKQISNGDGGENDWTQGYGFQFWRARHGAYRGDGAFGQFCVVVPDKDLVVAITASVSDMQGVLNVLWETIFPALSEAELPPARDELAGRLAKLRLPGPSVNSKSEPGLWDGIYQSHPASTASGLWTVALAKDSLVLTFSSSEGELIYRAGFDDWVRSQAVDGHPNPLAGMVAVSGEKLEVELHELTSPLRVNLELSFSGDELTVRTTYAGHFGPADAPEFVGKRVQVRPVGGE